MAAPENQERFRQLHMVVRPEVIGVTEEIIADAARQLGHALHEHIHVALADHIEAALTRLQGGLEIENPFLEEIRTLYPQMWNVAKVAAARIEAQFHLELPDSELGFLALHLQAAAQREPVTESVKITDGIRRALQALESKIGPIPRDSLEYARLVSHLRFAAQRVMKGEANENPLTDMIRERLPKSFASALEMTNALADSLGKPVPRDEAAYLAMHIARFLGERGKH
ncbi:hypothetical protein GCM10025857_14160 [Alicyclobacillus contaminans]|nr:hypothetical protein GCM10025857_14160 [Alicyclobacillus contaminans]